MVKDWHTKLVVLLTMIGGALRLWNLPQTTSFLGDQGRDALIVARIFTHFDLVSIGPVTSVGNMYLGPFYYYFMAPFLRLTFPSPLGPIYAVAFVSTITIPLLFYVGSKLLNRSTALLATFFFTFCSVIIYHSRFSWNPNIAPFFSLIFALALYKAQKNSWYWVLVAACFGILIQLHYMTLLVLPLTGLLWLYDLYQAHRHKNSLIQFLQASILSGIIWFALLFPLIFFDFRHGFLNTHAFTTLFTSDENIAQLENKEGSQFVQTLKETEGRGLQLFYEISIGHERKLNVSLLDGAYVFLILAVLKTLMTRRITEHDRGMIIVAGLVFSTIAGTAVYKHTVFDHYILFALPFSFLLLSYIGVKLLQSRTVYALIPLGFIGNFLFFNYLQSPLRPVAWKISDIDATSQSILQHLQPNESYNIALLTPTKDILGQNYRYFLSISDHPPVTIGQWNDIDALVVINEEKLPGEVTELGIPEITAFPDKNTRDVYTVADGIPITILRKIPQH